MALPRLVVARLVVVPRQSPRTVGDLQPNEGLLARLEAAGRVDRPELQPAPPRQQYHGRRRQKTVKDDERQWSQQQYHDKRHADYQRCVQWRRQGWSAFLLEHVATDRTLEEDFQAAAAAAAAAAADQQAAASSSKPHQAAASSSTQDGSHRFGPPVSASTFAER